MKYSIYLQSKYYLESPINNIVFKFHNFYINEILSLNLEYNYEEPYNASSTMYEYMDTKNRKITIIKNNIDNMIKSIIIKMESVEYYFTNIITADQYIIDGVELFLILSEI